MLEEHTDGSYLVLRVRPIGIELCPFLHSMDKFIYKEDMFDMNGDLLWGQKDV